MSPFSIVVSGSPIDCLFISESLQDRLGFLHEGLKKILLPSAKRFSVHSALLLMCKY